MEATMPQAHAHDHLPGREAKLFRNNKSQAVRIPADFEMPGDRVMIHRDGDRLILEPVRRRSLLAVLADLEPLGLEDQFPDVDETLLPPREVDL
jgi:antitoxin VapB